MNQLHHHHIVIVGGGAGGLELATRLGKKLGRKKLAKITLVDENPTHLWKPLLHEVAAGTLDAHRDELNYFVHASSHNYHFQLGRMIGLNRRQKKIILSSLANSQKEEIIPGRTLDYDTLVLAFGSVTNDLNVKGVYEHCLFLDNRREADHFHQLLLKNLLRMNARTAKNDDKLKIVIVGGGATGIELAAELHTAITQAVAYGFNHINPANDVSITLIEAAERILPNLPERISMLATKELEKRGVKILTGECVTNVSRSEMITTSQRKIPMTIGVWAVGVKSKVFEDKLDGLELNKRNQIMVKQTLQTTVDENIFAIGDCAACPEENSKIFVPPRAQAASQEATLLAKSLPRLLQHKTLLPFHYQDYGSLISLSRYNTLANLMGKLMGNIMFEGKIARLVYLSLYKKHQAILHGYSSVFFQTLSNILSQQGKSRLKLH